VVQLGEEVALVAILQQQLATIITLREAFHLVFELATFAMLWVLV
jgi:hypothetical protein